MKMAELKLTCTNLQLNVRGRAKAPFQAALLAWIDSRGPDAAVQPPEAALKVCDLSMISRYACTVVFCSLHLTLPLVSTWTAAVAGVLAAVAHGSLQA